MEEKSTTQRLSRSTSPSLNSTSPHAQETRKASLSSAHGGKNKAEEIARIDALATAPGVSMASFAHLDEKKILRKMDLRLIPMLALLYLLSFLDRGNIGNAKIEGLTEDLGMSGSQYNWCLTVFFFTYAAFEVPSNLLLKKLRPSIWLPTIMVAWGIVMTLMGIVQSYEGLLIARIFLGVTEAGLFPGVAYYITMWYARHEAQFRQALFFSAASVAGAFSGLLAYGIAHMDGIGNLAGWRWIFILEGILTVIVAIIAYFVLYDFPETASFLTEEERAFVVYRLKYQDFKDEREEGAIRVAQDDSFQWKFVKAAFLDWQIWTNVWVYWGMPTRLTLYLNRMLTVTGIVCPLYGISLFLPSIIRGLGYTSSTAQLLTVPIYITASVLAVAVAWYSDRVGKRYPFVLVCLCIMAIGFIMCVASATPGVIYAGVFIAACALYPAFPGNITWLSNSMLSLNQYSNAQNADVFPDLAGSTKRATGQAIQIAVGNLAGGMFNIYSQLHLCPNTSKQWHPTSTEQKIRRGMSSGMLSSSDSSARVSSPCSCWCSTTSGSIGSASGRWLKVRTADIRPRSWVRWATGRLRIGIFCRVASCIELRRSGVTPINSLVFPSPQSGPSLCPLHPSRSRSPCSRTRPLAGLVLALGDRTWCFRPRLCTRSLRLHPSKTAVSSRPPTMRDPRPWSWECRPCLPR
jgi:MFS family permease